VVERKVELGVTNLTIGALLVIFVLFLMLSNFRAAVITAMVIPITMLITATGMLQGRLSANLMSLGALDFGLIVDGALIIVENSLRHMAERRQALGRVLTPRERRETVAVSSREVIQPTVYGQAIIILVYVPLLSFGGVEGKTFLPMALTVIIALVTAFVVSLTFVPAMIAIAVTGAVQERENGFVRRLKIIYQPALAKIVRTPMPNHRDGGHIDCRSGVFVHAPGAGVRAHIGREKHSDGSEANSERVAVAVAGHAVRQRKPDQQISAGRLRVLSQRHSRSRRRSHAAKCYRHVHYPETSGGMARSGFAEGRPHPGNLGKGVTTAWQQNRVHAAHPGAFQRVDRRGARGPCDQGLRRRVRA
jgi:hypothetical protein